MLLEVTASLTGCINSGLCRGRQAFTDICKGLFVLHTNQICHLDMKTPNVLIGNDGTCKISDMGLSKMLGAGNTNTAAESMGTLAYISPEQIRTGRAGLPADIWALSTILWEVSPPWLVCSVGFSAAQVLSLLQFREVLEQIAVVAVDIHGGDNQPWLLH